MWQAYKEFWSHYADFVGVSNRPQYWFVYLINAVIEVVLMGTVVWMAFLSNDGHYSTPELTVTGIALVLLFLYSAAALVPALALSVRRLRDAGFHWALIFIMLVPYIGWIPLVILHCFPTGAGVYTPVETTKH
ncbi:DUF805 domain-containing protein [Furfurilactobacillus entadae]|uniref:DUF805 domain-containing protein n=1 Tax=Furfurilactobacillus entadae TaxID=2922307 RepID=UPI0035EADE34